jgi:hypothetical protein
MESETRLSTMAEFTEHSTPTGQSSGADHHELTTKKITSDAKEKSVEAGENFTFPPDYITTVLPKQDQPFTTLQYLEGDKQQENFDTQSLFGKEKTTVKTISPNTDSLFGLESISGSLQTSSEINDDPNSFITKMPEFVDKVESNAHHFADKIIENDIISLVDIKALKVPPIKEPDESSTFGDISLHVDMKISGNIEETTRWEDESTIIDLLSSHSNTKLTNNNENVPDLT